MIFSAQAPTFVPFRDMHNLHTKLVREHAYHAQASMEYWLVYSTTKEYITNPMYKRLFLVASYHLRQTEFSIIVAEQIAGLNQFENDYQAAFLLNATRFYIDVSVTFDKENYSLADEINDMSILLHGVQPVPSLLEGFIERLSLCIHALNRVIKCVTSYQMSCYNAKSSSGLEQGLFDSLAVGGETNLYGFVDAHGNMTIDGNLIVVGSIIGGGVLPISNGFFVATDVQNQYRTTAPQLEFNANSGAPTFNFKDNTGSFNSTLVASRLKSTATLTLDVIGPGHSTVLATNGISRFYVTDTSATGTVPITTTNFISSATSLSFQTTHTFMEFKANATSPIFNFKGNSSSFDSTLVAGHLVSADTLPGLGIDAAGGAAKYVSIYANGNQLHYMDDAVTGGNNFLYGDIWLGTGTRPSTGVTAVTGDFTVRATSCTFGTLLPPSPVGDFIVRAVADISLETTGLLNLEAALTMVQQSAGIMTISSDTAVAINPAVLGVPNALIGLDITPAGVAMLGVTTINGASYPPPTFTNWASPGAIGSLVPNTGTFTNMSISSASVGPVIFSTQLASAMAPSGYVETDFGVSLSTNNAISKRFHYVGPGSLSNYYIQTLVGGTAYMQTFPDHFVFSPAIGTSSGGTGLTTIGTINQVLASNGTNLYWTSLGAISVDWTLPGTIGSVVPNTGAFTSTSHTNISTRFPNPKQPAVQCSRKRGHRTLVVPWEICCMERTNHAWREFWRESDNVHVKCWNTCTSTSRWWFISHWSIQS